MGGREAVGRRARHARAVTTAPRSLPVPVPRSCRRSGKRRSVSSRSKRWRCGSHRSRPAHGSFPELIRDGHDGVLFAPGDPNALAAVCAMSRPTLSRFAELGRNARLSYEQRFDPDANIAQLVATYEFAMANPSQGAPADRRARALREHRAAEVLVRRGRLPRREVHDAALIRQHELPRPV